MSKEVYMTHRLDFPIRMRRNRRLESIRSLVRETELRPSDLIAPLFLMEGENAKISIVSMSGIDRLTLDLAIREAAQLHKRGIQAVALFPCVEPSLKTPLGEEAWNLNGLISRAIYQIKEEIPSLCVIADVALDPYTSHGHDGLIDPSGEILNDETIECLIRMALAQAESGVDFVAPSDMMDGRVRAIRGALDRAGYEHVGILAYSVKYASALYRPFREAIGSQLKNGGDKKTYQIDPANVREALFEAALDEEEGADILMIKPATLYLDVIGKLREQTRRPIAAYHVSGEYAMVMAAHQMGWLDANQLFFETLLSIKRAGADMILTYAVNQILESGLIK